MTARPTAHATRWLVPPLPAFVYAVVALTAGGLMTTWLRLDPGPVVPHLALVLALAALQYGIAALLWQLPVRVRYRRLLIWVVTMPVVLVWTCYYVLLALCLQFMGDIPVRRLVESYASEVPTLVLALPVSGALLAVIGAVLGLLLLGCAALITWGFERAAPEIDALIASGPRRIAARVCGYGSFLYLWLAFTIGFPWNIDTHEPLTSGWSGLQLVNVNVFGRRHPVEAARDRVLEAEWGKLAAQRRPNIVLIYVDALRADATQPYGAARENMPFITGLVRRGDLTQVDFGIAACSATLCGLGALLQSKPARRLAPDNFTLPKLLAQQGYRNAYVLSSNHQGYFDLKRYYEPYQFYLDGKDIDPAHPNDDYVVLSGIERLGHWDGRPTFLMLGLESAHIIGMRREENRRFQPDRLRIDWRGKSGFAETYRNNYDNGILQADDVIAKAWSRLGDLGYLRDDTLVVITADHGESLGERGIFGHVKSLWNTELRIPLWIRAPGVDLRNTRLARQVDVPATLVAALGLPVPHTWAGRSLTVPEPQAWSEHYLPDRPDLFALVHYRAGTALKYLSDRGTQTEAVFDLFTDPDETRNVIDSVPPDELAQMRMKARSILLDR